MEEELTTPEEVSEIYKRLLDIPLELLSPQAEVFLSAFLQSYDPKLPPERQAQYSQIQVSHLPDGGGPGAAGIVQRRAITHINDRVIGHNLLRKLFLDVSNDDRIKQNDATSYPLLNQPTTQQGIDYTTGNSAILSNQGKNLLQASPTVNPTLSNILTPSPIKSTRRVKPAKTATGAQAATTSAAVSQPNPPLVATATVHKKPSPIELVRSDPPDPILAEPSQSQVQPTTVEGHDDFPVSLPAPVTSRSLA